VVSIIKDFLMKTIFKNYGFYGGMKMKKGLRMKKRIFTGIISLLITSILLSGCGGQKVQKTNLEDSGTGRELKKFKVGYLASPGHVLYFVAKEKDF